VRDSLAGRPAGRINALSQNAQHTFAGLFNGARCPGHFAPNGRLFVGKAECQWHWPAAWEELKAAGLIDYHTEERANHPSFGGTRTHLHWNVTALGQSVRGDDVKWFRELMDARGQDEA
jgi:hypothetical protein